jgi:hypothetical protein
VDDSPEKHQRSYGNLIRVSAYTGAATDSELPVLLQYLDRLRAMDIVRAVEKRHWAVSVAGRGEVNEDQCA